MIQWQSTIILNCYLSAEYTRKVEFLFPHVRRYLFFLPAEQVAEYLSDRTSLLKLREIITLCQLKRNNVISKKPFARA